MNLTTEISSMVELLEDNDKVFVFQMIKRLLRDDIATEQDLSDIAIAEQELADGKTTSFADINWD